MNYEDMSPRMRREQRIFHEMFKDSGSSEPESIGPFDRLREMLKITNSPLQSSLNMLKRAARSIGNAFSVS